MSDAAVPMRWLVVGANGMLGHDLMEVIAEAGHEVVGMDLPEIDITSPESVTAALDYRPTRRGRERRRLHRGRRRGGARGRRAAW